MRLEAKVGRKVQLSHWREDGLEKSLLSLVLPQEDKIQKWSQRDTEVWQLPGEEQGAEQDPVIARILEYGLPSSQLYHPQRDILAL